MFPRVSTKVTCVEILSQRTCGVPENIAYQHCRSTLNNRIFKQKQDIQAEYILFDIIYIYNIIIYCADNLGNLEMRAMPFNMTDLLLRIGDGTLIQQLVLNLNIARRSFNTDSLRDSMDKYIVMFMEVAVDVL